MTFFQRQDWSEGTWSQTSTLPMNNDNSVSGVCYYNNINCHFGLKKIMLDMLTRCKMFYDLSKCQHRHTENRVMEFCSVNQFYRKIKKKDFNHMS